MPLRFSTSKQGVLWHGSFFVRHSLALVNRELTLALLDTGRFDIGISHYEQPTFGAKADPRFERLATAMRVHPSETTVTVRHQWPPDFIRPRGGKLVLIQPWEFGSLPIAWVEGIAQGVDEAWVPSTFVRDEYIESGVPAEKVVVVPNGVNTGRFHPGVEPCAIPTQKGFKFLFVGGTIARKGIDVLLEAYSRAFAASDDVSLVIKDFGTDTFYAGQGAAAHIAALQAKPGAPEIVYLNQDMTEGEVASLYTACDALVHPYRGEGYGLPIAEAMACGKPSILTGFGAALDFANAGNSYLIPAQRVSLPEKRIGEMPTVDYPWWAHPDVDALVETMRHVYDHRDAAEARGKQAALDIAGRHTWAHAAIIAADRLEALNAAPGATASAHRSVVTPWEDRKQEALTLTRTGDWNGAVTAIEKCLKAAPQDWDLINAQAIALFRVGKVEEARELLVSGIERAPNKRDFHHNLAYLLLETGEPAPAIIHATKALAFTPDSPDIRRTLERAAVEAQRECRRIRKKLSSSASACKKDPAYAALSAAIETAKQAMGTKEQPLPPAFIPQRLSVVMIVKDEEKYLRQCLESVKAVAHEIVVVDTGSTDRTVEIAQEFGAVIVEHPWNDDFSAARNAGLDRATGDWALWIDADERLPEGEGDLLRYLMEAAEPNVGGYMVNIRNFMQTGDNPEVCWHRACRLFRREPGVRFTGRIHEQNMRALQAAGYVCALSKLNLDHYGYAANVMQERNKHERFIRMLTREVEESPDDQYRTFHLFNLGNAYFTFGDMRNAANWFEKAAQDADPHEEYTALLFIEWATALYATGRPQEALKACDMAENIGIIHPGIDFARGHSWLHLEDYPSAEKQFRSAVESGASGKFVHTGDAGAYTYKAWYGLALACTGGNHFAEAVNHCNRALQQKPDFLDARYLLANCLRRLNRTAEARRQLETLLQRAPSHTLAISELGCLLHDSGDYAGALPHLQRSAYQQNTVDVWTRLGVCAERVGRYTVALDAFVAARRLAPHSAEAAVNVARAYVAIQDYARALDTYTEAVTLDSTYANAFFNAGDLLYKLGYFAQAAETVCAGLALDPTNAAGFFVLGNCYFQTGDFAAACATYREALNRQPGYTDAVNNLTLAEEMASRQPKTALAS
jgi:tetratricopeptide (TPR) repeat protein